MLERSNVVLFFRFASFLLLLLLFPSTYLCLLLLLLPLQWIERHSSPPPRLLATLSYSTRPILDLIQEESPHSSPASEPAFLRSTKSVHRQQKRARHALIASQSCSRPSAILRSTARSSAQISSLSSCSAAASLNDGPLHSRYPGPQAPRYLSLGVEGASSWLFARAGKADPLPPLARGGQLGVRARGRPNQRGHGACASRGVELDHCNLRSILGE